MNPAFAMLALLWVTLVPSAVLAQTSAAAERRHILQRLEQTVIEKVTFQNASLEDWIGFLQETLRASERPINFVITPAAARFAQGKTITLELRQVPARVVLDYGARLLELEFKIEPHAIVINAPLVVPPRPPVP